jgi:hypothetical protein
MDLFKDPLPHPAMLAKILMLVALAGAFAACGCSKNVPSEPAPPKPHTKLEKQLPLKIKSAVFTYSVKPGTTYQMEHPAATVHMVIMT